jgi:hypothetical protein
MPLPIAVSEDLAVPGSMFNEDGLAVLMLSGGRYGGDWVIGVGSLPYGEHDPIGELRTAVDERRKQELLHDPGYPDRAIESAFIWLMDQAKRQGLRVVGFENMNSRYSESERPFFCLAQAVIASRAFEPAPGVTYADEMTLDAVMVPRA